MVQRIDNSRRSNAAVTASPGYFMSLFSYQSPSVRVTPRFQEHLPNQLRTQRYLRTCDSSMLKMQPDVINTKGKPVMSKHIV